MHTHTHTHAHRSAPDQLQALYERACDYLELDRRVEVLNARFTVLQNMLDMMRGHIVNTHRCVDWAAHVLPGRVWEFGGGAEVCC